MVVKIDINGSVGGGCGGKWHLEVWSWWRRFFKVRIVWGVKVILIREGMVWVLCGCKVVWDVVGRSGEVVPGFSGPVKVVVFIVGGSR